MVRCLQTELLRSRFYFCVAGIAFHLGLAKGVECHACYLAHYVCRFHRHSHITATEHKEFWYIRRYRYDSMLLVTYLLHSSVERVGSDNAVGGNSDLPGLHLRHHVAARSNCLIFKMVREHWFLQMFLLLHCRKK